MDVSQIEDWLVSVSSRPELQIEEMMSLSGGAIQENYKLTCASGDVFVLRADAPTSVSASRARSQEFALLTLADRFGVTVPKPLWCCTDKSVFGRDFYLMQFLEGVALGPKIVKDQSLAQNRDELARRLGRELARIHKIKAKPGEVDFLGPPEVDSARSMIETLRISLDSMDEDRPALEWGLRWAELHPPASTDVTFLHGDFRTGNYLVDHGGLTAILDWEFAGYGDPMSDIGWFCAECWRFSRADLEAGGIAPRAPFYAAYEAESGRPIDPTSVSYWELMAHLRWAVIALQQCHRHLSGEEVSLELALIGRLLPNLESKILEMTKPEAWEADNG